MAGMYQGGLLDTGGGGDLDNGDCDLVPTTWPSNAVQELSSVVGTGRRIVGGATELGVGSSGAGQFQKGDRPKSINKSPEKRTRLLIEIITVTKQLKCAFPISFEGY